MSGHPAKVAAATTASIGRTKLRMVETVEELGPELDAKPVLWTKLGIFKKGKVKVFRSVTPNIRLGARIGAVAEVGAVCEYGSVKPPCEPVL